MPIEYPGQNRDTTVCVSGEFSVALKENQTTEHKREAYFDSSILQLEPPISP
jgi:hypothetical protein